MIDPVARAGRWRAERAPSSYEDLLAAITEWALTCFPEEGRRGLEWETLRVEEAEPPSAVPQGRATVFPKRASLIGIPAVRQRHLADYLEGDTNCRSDAALSLYIHLHEVIHGLFRDWAAAPDLLDDVLANQELEEGAVCLISRELFPHLFVALRLEDLEPWPLLLNALGEWRWVVEHFGRLARVDALATSVNPRNPCGAAWDWTRGSFDWRERVCLLARALKESWACGGDVTERDIRSIRDYCLSMRNETPFTLPGDARRERDRCLERLRRGVCG